MFCEKGVSENVCVTYFKQPIVVQLLALNTTSVTWNNNDKLTVFMISFHWAAACRAVIQVISLLLSCWKPWALLNQMPATWLSLPTWEREEGNVTQLHVYTGMILSQTTHIVTLTAYTSLNNVNCSFQYTCLHLRPQAVYLTVNLQEGRGIHCGTVRWTRDIHSTIECLQGSYFLFILP